MIEKAEKQLETFTRDTVHRVTGVFANLHGALENIEQDFIKSVQDQKASVIDSLQAKQALLTLTSDLAKVIEFECNQQSFDDFNLFSLLFIGHTTKY